MSDRQDDVKTPKPPRPRRHRWLKGLALVGLLLVVTVVVGLFWLDHKARQAEQRLQEVIDDIRQRGEPLAWDEFPNTPVPDQENAALLYRRAIDGLCLWLGGETVPQRRRATSQHAQRLKRKIDEVFGDQTERADRKQQIRENLLALRDVLTDCREARARTTADWKPDFSRGYPSISGAAGFGWNDVSLSTVLTVAALQAHDDGDDAACIEYLLDLLAFGESHYSVPGLDWFSLGNMAEEQAHRVIEEEGGSFSPGSEDRHRGAELLRLLIEELLSEQSIRTGSELAWMGKRATNYSLIEPVRQSVLSGGAATDHAFFEFPWYVNLFPAALRAILSTDEVRMLTHDDQVVRAVREPTYPQVKSKLPHLAAPPFGLGRYTHVYSSRLVYDCRRWSRSFHRVLARRRMAATALAIRSYQVDNGGRRPARLADLVPQHLPHVPRDPLGPGDRLIQYRAEVGIGLLWSVGPDGQDEQGHFHMDFERYFDETKGRDVVFFLDGRPSGSDRRPE